MCKSLFSSSSCRPTIYITGFVRFFTSNSLNSKNYVPLILFHEHELRQHQVKKKFTHFSLPKKEKEKNIYFSIYSSIISLFHFHYSEILVFSLYYKLKLKDVLNCLQKVCAGNIYFLLLKCIKK